jgi:hypothetical protein
MINTFELKNAHGNNGLYINGKFAGLYSERFGISQFSGNKDQIFDRDLCVEFMRKINPKGTIYSAVSNASGQMYLQVSFYRIVLSEGTQTIHNP